MHTRGGNVGVERAGAVTDSFKTGFAPFPMLEG
jgi:hypothetical protein